MASLLPSPVLLLALISHVVRFTEGSCHSSKDDVILKNHVIYSLSADYLMDCWVTCSDDDRCQSLNYFVILHLCEINNRTIEHAPDDEIKTMYTVYFDKPFRAVVGTVKEVPAVSCPEILKTVGRVSGRYWLVDHPRSNVPFQAFCNMTTLAIEDCPVGQCKNGGNCMYFGSGKYQCACPKNASGIDCSETSVLDCNQSQPLGMESKVISDAHIHASSFWDPRNYPFFARLGQQKYWVPKHPGTGEWIEVDLSSIKTIKALATQGSPYGWITGYSISYYDDGPSFKQYEGGKVFAGNVDTSNIVRNELVPSVNARFIRLIVEKYHSWPNLRMELYGCG